jgi:hypothetical protein
VNVSKSIRSRRMPGTQTTPTTRPKASTPLYRSITAAEIRPDPARGQETVSAPQKIQGIGGSGV